MWPDFLFPWRRPPSPEAGAPHSGPATGRDSSRGVGLLAHHIHPRQWARRALITLQLVRVGTGGGWLDWEWWRGGFWMEGCSGCFWVREGRRRKARGFRRRAAC